MDNKKRYLDKVVDFLVEDTKVDHENRMIFFPFTYKRSLRQGSNNLTPFHRLLFETYIPIGGFMEYIDESFGITSEEGIVYVWETYKVIMRDIVFGKDNINESVGNKMTKNEYLDKVVNFIIQDTKFDSQYDNYLEWDQPYWHPPFEEYPFGYGSEVWVDSLFDSSRFKISPLSHDDTPPHLTAFTPTAITEFIGNFYTYCKETYGLTEQETDYAWSRYADFMKKKLNGKNSINESMDRRDIYLDKVVNYLVEDVEIDYKGKYIYFPFITPHVPPLFFPNDSIWLPSISSPYPDFIGFFSTYCIDTYGLTEDEIDYVWQKVRKNLLGKIKNKKSINESVDKISKGEYMDKIIDYLVDDTMVDQKNKVWYPPFPTDHAKPTFNHFYGLIPMTDHLELKFLIGNSFVRNFFNYCKDTYGLTDDEELRKVWKRYLKVLTPKINGFSIINGVPTINESVERLTEYLDKVVDFLVYDTKMDYVKGKVWYPFMNDRINPFKFSPQTILTTEVPTSFEHYVNTTYFIDWDSTEYVWRKYISIMMDKYKGNNINESVVRKSDYLDKIVGFLVDDTKVDHKQEELTLSLGSVGVKIMSFSDFLWNTKHFLTDIPSYFSNYIKDTYGLSGDEIRYVWEQYRYTIRDKILSKPLNESVDRKNDYLDKIVDFLIDDTEYNIYVNRFSNHSETKVEIWFPSTGEDEDPYDYSIYDIYNWSDGEEWILSGGDDIDTVCGTYSICDIDTVQELYNRYIQKLSTIIYEEMLLKKNGDRLNESVDRKDEYLDKIVEFLVTDTKVNQRDKVWYPPFYRLSSLSYDFFFNEYRGGDYPASFSNYTKDMYGLSDDDKKYVWDRYKNIILDKFNNSGNINESVDRKDEYLDKIVDFLVDDTEITIEKNDKSFIPPFTSVWFSPLYLKLMSDSQLEINFLTYCKDTYGLTNSEIKVVYSKYRKTILNKFKGS
jgi:hypothetical protein